MRRPSYHAPLPRRIIYWLWTHWYIIPFIIALPFLLQFCGSFLTGLGEVISTDAGDVLKAKDQELNAEAPMYYIVEIGQHQIKTIEYNCSGMENEPVISMKDEFIGGKYEVYEPPCLPMSKGIGTSVAEPGAPKTY